MSALDGLGLEEVRRRIEEWTRTGDMDRLWPDVALEERLAAREEIRRVARAVLAGESPPALGARGPSARRALGVAAFTTGMGPLLGWWIDQGLLEAAPDVGTLLAYHLDHGRRRAAKQSAALLEVVAAMRAEGVDPVVLKGMHTARTYFPDPGTRPGADIDMLVAPGEVAAAARALERVGLSQVQRTLVPPRSEWAAAGVDRAVHSLEVDHADNPWSVDLHATLDRWYFRGLRAGLGPVDEVRTETLTYEGESVRVLAQPDLVAFLALHGSHDIAKTRVVRLVELVLVAGRDTRGGALDWQSLRRRLDETGCARLAHPAFELAEALLPGAVDGTFLDGLRALATRRTRRVVASVIDADLGPPTSRSLDHKLMWAKGVRQLAGNLSELLWPSDDGTSLGRAAVLVRGVRTYMRGRGR